MIEFQGTCGERISTEVERTDKGLARPPVASAELVSPRRREGGDTS
jgi:hypothetical protein